MILTSEQLQDLGMAVFREAGVPEEAAASVVEALVRAELDGLPSHGFSRIPFYVDQALSGKVKARAIPLVRQPAPAAVLVDAGNGFAFPAILAGLEKAIPLARGNGVSVLGVTRSHHCGVVGLYAERIAEAGLISLIFSNTPAAMAPWNGSKASFGTNPLAFGCPREGKHPLVIDMSLSKVARGKIMGAKQRGEAIPEGWALDAAGRATTDPVAALGGTMIPVGDAKGAALALMVEILSNIVEFRNGESGMHVLNVQAMTEMILTQLMRLTDQYPLTAEDISLITMASSLHDIGKIAIPEEILNKPGRFTDEEFAIMKTHSAVGSDMLDDLELYKDEKLVKVARDICR